MGGNGGEGGEDHGDTRKSICLWCDKGCIIGAHTIVHNPADISLFGEFFIVERMLSAYIVPNCDKTVWDGDLSDMRFFRT